MIFQNKVAFLIITLLCSYLALTSSSIADVLCIKNKQRIKKGSLVAKDILTVAKDACPNKFTAISSIVGKGSISVDEIDANAISSEKIKAGAVTLDKLGSDVKYPGQTGEVLLGVAHFSSGTPATCTANGEGYWSTFGGNTCCVHAPLYIPDGVTLKTIEYILLDMDAGLGESHEIELRRKDMRIIDDSEEIAQVFSEDDSDLQVISDDTLDHAVDLSNFSYFISGCFKGDNNRLYGVRVLFE